MGLRVDDIVKSAVSNVIDTMTDAKTKKAEKAFASFLDNAASNNIASNNVASTGYLSANGVTASADNADSAKSDSGDSSKLDNKPVDSGKEVKTAQKTDSKDSTKNVSEEDVTVEEVGLVEEIESAIKTMLAQQLGITVEEIDAALDELGINAVDLLQGNNLLDFVMQINEIDDMSVVLTDEGIMNQVKDLAQEINFVVDDVLEGQDITKELIPDIAQKVSSVQTADVVKGSEVQQEVTIVQPQEDADVPQTKVVVETDKPEETGNETFTSENDSDSTFTESHGMHGMQTTQSSQVVDTLTQTQVQASYTSVDMEEIVSQIVEQIKVQVSEETTSMEMQLNPESYGKLQLNVAVKDGVVTAQMAVENEAVRSALEAQVVQLREEMNNQGMKVDAIEVTIASHEFERNLEQENNASEQAFEEAQAKATRQRMNLNLTMEDFETQDVQNMSEAEILERKIMLESGNRMSIQA